MLCKSLLGFRASDALKLTPSFQEIWFAPSEVLKERYIRNNRRFVLSRLALSDFNLILGTTAVMYLFFLYTLLVFCFCLQRRTVQITLDPTTLAFG